MAIDIQIFKLKKLLEATCLHISTAQKDLYRAATQHPNLNKDFEMMVAGLDEVMERLNKVIFKIEEEET